MNEYIVDGQLYQVSDEDLDHFLNKYPNAILQKPDTVEAEKIVSDTVETPVNESMESDELIQPKKEENISSDLIIEDAEKAKLDIERENIGFFQNLYNVTRKGLLNPKKGIKNTILMGVMNGLELFDVTEPEDRNKVFEMLQKIPTPGVGSISALPGQGLAIAGQSVEDIEKEQAELQKKSKKFDFDGPSEALVNAFDEISKGNFKKGSENLFEAFESGLSGALESSPSLIAASTGLGGLALYGMSISGNKFAEELELNPEETLANLNINAVGSGAIETMFELVTWRLLKGAGVIRGKKGADAAKEFINRGVGKIAKAFGFAWAAEGTSEAATEATNILYDNLTLQRETTKIASKEGLYRIADGFILGSIMQNKELKLC